MFLGLIVPQPPPLSGLLILNNILYFTNSQEVRATRAPGAGTKMLGKAAATATPLGTTNFK